MTVQAAIDEYALALRQGQKEYRELLMSGRDPHPAVLDEILPEGVGESAAKALVEAYSEKPFDTIEEAVNRAKLNRTASEALRNYGVFDGLPETDQMSFFTMGI